MKVNVNMESYTEGLGLKSSKSVFFVEADGIRTVSEIGGEKAKGVMDFVDTKKSIDLRKRFLLTALFFTESGRV